MGKTRDLFRKLEIPREQFHAKMGTIKDRSVMDLTEAEDIKRWQEYTEELYKKILMNCTTMIVWSVSQSQTFWSISQVGLGKHCCQ